MLRSKDSPRSIYGNNLSPGPGGPVRSCMHAFIRGGVSEADDGKSHSWSMLVIERENLTFTNDER